MDVTNLKTAAANNAYLKTTFAAVDPSSNKFLKVNPGDKLIDATALRESVETMFNLASTSPPRLLDFNT